MSDRYNPKLSYTRNKEELCDMFNDLLFMKVEKIMPELAEDEAREKMRLSKEAERLLKENNLVNCIFRQWYQLNWGEENWNEYFDGSTPRQELMSIDKDIREGRAMLSIDLEWKIPSPYTSSNSDIKEELVTVPQYFGKEELDSAGGAFLYGLDQLEKKKDGVVAPNFDPDFREFAEKMKKEKDFMSSFSSFNLHKFSEETIYWRIFIDDEAMAIVRRVQPKLSKTDSSYACMKISNIISGLAGYQKDGELDYIMVDDLFKYIWQVFREYNSSLFSYEYFISEEYYKDYDKNLEDEEKSKSISALYLLGYAIDEHFLFPADRYFNAVEIVWQDKTLFMDNIAILYQILNNDMKLPDPPPSEKAADKIYEELDIENTVYDPKSSWINPATCFRFHNWTLETL